MGHGQEAYRFHGRPIEELDRTELLAAYKAAVDALEKEQDKRAALLTEICRLKSSGISG